MGLSILLYHDNTSKPTDFACDNHIFNADNTFVLQNVYTKNSARPLNTDHILRHWM